MRFYSGKYLLNNSVISLLVVFIVCGKVAAGISSGQGIVTYSVKEMQELEFCPGAKTRYPLKHDKASIFITPAGEAVKFKLKKRIAGVYIISIRLLKSKPFVEPKILIDDAPVLHAKIKRSEISDDSVTLEVITGMLDSSLHCVELRVPDDKQMALCRISYRIDQRCFIQVPAACWNITQDPEAKFPAPAPWELGKDSGYPGFSGRTLLKWHQAGAAATGAVNLSSSGGGTIFAVTHLYCPIPWSHYKLKLVSTGPAELLINGIPVGRTNAPEFKLNSQVDWSSLCKYTAVRIIVKMAAGGMRHSACIHLRCPAVLFSDKFQRLWLMPRPIPIGCDTG